MIQGQFEHAKRAVATLSQGDFSLVSEALDNAAGELLSIQQQLAMIAQCAGHLLHRLYLAAHHLTAPEVEELASPNR